MPKSVIAHGAPVPSEYFNALNGIDGTTGIVHDGADTDGHAPKVILTDAANVSGVLPLANVASHVHDGVSQSQIDLSQHVTGTLPVAKIAALSSDDIDNDSGVTGVTATAALDELLAAVVALALVDSTNIDQPVRTDSAPAFAGVGIGAQGIDLGSGCKILYAVPSAGALADAGSAVLAALDTSLYAAIIDVFFVKDDGTNHKIVGACIGPPGTALYYSVAGSVAGPFVLADPGSDRISLDLNSGNIRITNLTGSAGYYQAEVRRVRYNYA